MSRPRQSRQWTLQHKPFENPILDGPNATFQLETKEIPDLLDGQVLLKPIYLSNDPAQRCWISATADPERLYLPPINVGEVMRAGAIAEVLESRTAHLPAGALVFASTNWSEYAVLNKSDCMLIKPVPGLSVTHFMGSLGLPGLTAYYALKEVVKVKPGESVVVSGAAGAVGNMAVQIAKRLLGCKHVIGIAGSDAKCRFVEKLGADICVNYKSPTFEQDLNRATEGFVEVYFDNVGGYILDLMLRRLKRHGRIAACGTISNYNNDCDPVGLENFYEVISMRLKIYGFIVFDYAEKRAEVSEILTQAWKDGKIIIGDEIETIIESRFEDVPRTWLTLYDGVNTGKMITKLVK